MNDLFGFEEPSSGEQPSHTNGGEGVEKRRSPWRIVVAVLLALVIAAAGFTAGWLGNFYSTDPRLRELAWLMDVLERNHYRDVDRDAVYGGIYDALMPDQFSHYFTPEEYATVLAESEGHNEGVGISLLPEEDGSVRLFSVVENSPACLAGLKRGMYLLGYGEEGGEVLTGTADQITAYVRSHGRSVLYASFDRGATPGPENAFCVQRSAYSAAYVLYADSEASYAFRGAERLSLTQTGLGMAGLDGDTAYIRLDAFDGNCAAEFDACMELMRERGRGELVLDLRGNGGGYLADLQSISSHLLRNAPGGTPLVAYAENREGDRSNFYAMGNDFSDYFAADATITVLADEYSASASECLIGAMIDYGTIDYGDIWLRSGETGTCATYGKGVMQSTFVSPTGGAFQLTVARIYWPGGNCIHERGIRATDGANPVSAPLLPTERDAFLEQVLATVCG